MHLAGTVLRPLVPSKMHGHGTHEQMPNRVLALLMCTDHWLIACLADHQLWRHSLGCDQGAQHTGTEDLALHAVNNSRHR